MNANRGGIYISLQRKTKYTKKQKSVCHKFPDAVQATREQTEQFWNELSLPKIKPVNRKPKPKHKGSHNVIKERLKANAYKQAEERDEGYCLICGGLANQHHHVIRQSTRYGPEYIQRMENVVSVCSMCHTMGARPIHDPKGKGDKQTYLEEWQQRYYPEYVAMMRELAKVTGCKDQWLIDRWNDKYNNSTTKQQEVAR